MFILTRDIGRLFPYMVVVSALGVTFFFVVQILVARGPLLPGILIVGSFILFVLWLTGLIETSLQLYGVSGNVNDNCQIWVVENESRGNSINTLAWLTQSTICESISSFFSCSCITRLTIQCRQLLENSLCVRARQYDILPVDDDHVVAGPSGLLPLMSHV